MLIPEWKAWHRHDKHDDTLQEKRMIYLNDSVYLIEIVSFRLRSITCKSESRIG